jgi:hypothetical protein
MDCSRSRSIQRIHNDEPPVLPRSSNSNLGEYLGEYFGILLACPPIHQSIVSEAILSVNRAVTWLGKSIKCEFVTKVIIVCAR